MTRFFEVNCEHRARVTQLVTTRMGVNVVERIELSSHSVVYPRLVIRLRVPYTSNKQDEILPALPHASSPFFGSYSDSDKSGFGTAQTEDGGASASRGSRRMEQQTSAELTSPHPRLLRNQDRNFFFKPEVLQMWSPGQRLQHHLGIR